MVIESVERLTKRLSFPLSWKNLHYKLIQRYIQQCHEDLHLYPDDGYYYQHIVYHIIEAEEDETLQAVLRNFSWMAAKVKVMGNVSYLIDDLQMAIAFLILVDKVSY